MPELRISSDLDALSAAAAEDIIALLRAAIDATGVATLGLTGGATPRRLYERLAADERVNAALLASVHLFWGDERCTPPDSPDSNFKLAWDAWLHRAPIPPSHIHRMPGERQDADAAAAEYEAEIRRATGVEPPAVPQFDVLLLGLGADGHTASLFPGSPALEDTERLVVSVDVDAPIRRRLTITFPIINASRAVLMLVAGASKAAAVRRTLAPAAGEAPTPAARVRPAGRCLWFVDRAAAP
jgi:6-phosphogluconolactonase